MIPPLFIQKAANVLGDTDNGLSSSQIVRLCSEYAINFNVEIPYFSTPFPPEVGNKRTALKKNITTVP